MVISAQAQVPKGARQLDPRNEAEASLIEGYKSRIRQSIQSKITGMSAVSGVYTIGNSHSGMSAFGINMVDLPSGSVMVASKQINGNNEEFLSWFTFSFELPAANFVYPIEDTMRTTYANYTGFITYRLYILYPNGELYEAHQTRKLNEYGVWFNQAEPLIYSGTATIFPNGQTYIYLDGSVASDPNARFALKGAETSWYAFYALPEKAVTRQGNQVRIDASQIPNVTFGINVELTILAAMPDGTSDQFSVRVRPVRRN